MDITLVTSIMNDDIHGTDNDKKTGCGINLQKGDNINKYRRGGKMADLKEVTCERCKNAFAKKMIKADKKEMARLLKEEKLREKAGLADEGIVPLGGTVAKITSAQNSEPEPEPVPFERTPVSAPEPEEPKQTIAGTGVALDSSLAAFNITPPPAEEPAKPESNDDFMAQFAVKPPHEEEKPAPSVNNIQDDFMAQFAVKPPHEEEKPAPSVNNLQDDFLAQFAVPAPSRTEPEEPEEPEESIDFSAINPPPSAYEEPAELPPEADERPVGIIDEDDIMKMFAFGNVKASSSQSPAVDNSKYNYVTPTEEEPVYTPEPQPVAETPASEEVYKSSDFGYVANKLFGIENSEQSEPEQEEPEEMQDIELPSLYDVSSVQEEEAVPEYTAPAFDDIELPSLDDVSPVQEEPVPEYTAPAFDDIELPSLDDVAPVQEEEAVPEYTAPAFDDIEVPSFDDVQSVQEEEAVPEYTAPAFDDIEVPSFENAEPVTGNGGFPSLDDMASLMEQEEIVDEIEEVSEEIPEETTYTRQPAPVQSAPVQPTPVQPVPQQVPVQQMASPVQPAPMPVPPMPAPVQSVPVQPAYPQQSAYPQQPVYPQQSAYAQQPMIGQVVSVPQFKGYDQNNQPVYMYVQMQLTGYSANGQPIYMPFGQPAMQQPVMQQPYVQPVPQPAQVVSPVPQKPAVPDNQPLTPGQKIAAAAAAKGGMPATSANISKISVHEHSRSTSQVFINAIAESKEYANKSLTETQGNQARNMPVLDSIEDMLSAMGDNSEKEKRQQQESMKKNVPVYQEYTASSNPVRTGQAKPQKPAEPQRPLTKAELKEKKKQEKIDAKFKKDLAKRGF